MKRFWTAFIVTLLVELAFFWLGGWNFEYERTVGYSLVTAVTLWVAFCIGMANK